LALALASGALLGLALLKFGNPVIFDYMVVKPQTLPEWLISPWPIVYGYGIAALFIVAGIVTGTNKTSILPPFSIIVGVWLGWQGISTVASVDQSLSLVTLCHFVFCVLLFFTGWRNPPQSWAKPAFIAAFLLFFIVVVRLGIEQHFGGLAATRRAFFLYVYPTLKNPPADFIRKMMSERIFSTLYYPNTLAAVILLAVPIMVGLLVQLRDVVRPAILVAIGGIIGCASLACLYWSGSKTGWLIFCLLALVALVRLPISRGRKIAIATILCVAGGTAFLARNKAYFDKGATSVGARFQYWKAAGLTGLSHPVFGTGPGTFAIAYKRIKPPDAEMAKLAHNDYLEQFSDSGLIGFFSYFAFVTGVLIVLYRKSSKTLTTDGFWIWLGLFGVALHSLVEFHLYIPALAWPQFFLFGRQLATKD
jgi:O-antigen ligase